VPLQQLPKPRNLLNWQCLPSNFQQNAGHPPNKPPIEYWDRHRTLPKIPSVGLSYGGHGSHKTGLNIKLGLDIVAQGGNVLYIATEDSYGVDVARLPAAVTERNWTLEKLHDRWHTIEEGFNLLRTDEHQALADTCGDWRTSIIFIDVLTKAMAGDINTPEMGAGIMHAMQRLAERFKCPVIANHHPGKDAERGMMGSALLTHLADFVWRVRHYHGQVLVNIEKLKNGPADRTIKFDVDATDVPVVVDSKDDATFDAIPTQPHHRAAHVKTFLDNTPDVFDTAADLAKRLHENTAWGSDMLEGTISKMLRRMSNRRELDGYVSIYGEGVNRDYVFTRPGSAPAQHPR
jgi:hypothetical protein